MVQISRIVLIDGKWAYFKVIFFLTIDKDEFVDF